eukprot:scaffold2926_cov109-Skeletonema_dohrnii-CCMP3373.AAC.10
MSYSVHQLVHEIDTGSTTLEVGTPPPSSQRKPFACKVFFHRFHELSAERDQYVRSPEFECNGRKWRLHVYPGGNVLASEGYASVFLEFCSQGTCAVIYDIAIQSVAGYSLNRWKANQIFSNFTEKCWGWNDYMKRSDILNLGSNLLDGNGTLAMVVSMTVKEELSSVQTFVPKNPLIRKMQGMFLDESTADVSFDVKVNDTKTSSVSFQAHSQILQGFAPMLADLFESNLGGEMISVPITDVNSDIFRLLLWYVYGGQTEEEVLRVHAKEIIDAADKYAIVNLKLEAEAAYVNSTTITMDNVIDNLLYADARNCALLKEVVMDFLAENHDEAVRKVSFDDVPGHIVKDLLVAFGMSKREGKCNEEGKDFDTMRVSELRVKLDKMGLDVDGSREAMIKALRKSSKQS